MNNYILNRTFVKNITNIIVLLQKKLQFIEVYFIEEK